MPTGTRLRRRARFVRPTPIYRAVRGTAAPVGRWERTCCRLPCRSRRGRAAIRRDDMAGASYASVPDLTPYLLGNARLNQALHQQTIALTVRVCRLHEVRHAAGHGNLVGEFPLSLNYGIIDLVVGLGASEAEHERPRSTMPSC